jgi:hypothetical protein
MGLAALPVRRCLKQVLSGDLDLAGVDLLLGLGLLISL